jgi:hypothetical protein
MIPKGTICCVLEDDFNHFENLKKKMWEPKHASLFELPHAQRQADTRVRVALR